MGPSRSARRTTVVVGPDPWLEHLESMVRTLEVDVAATVTPLGQALETVVGADPDLVLIGVSRSTTSDVTAFIQAAGSHVRSIVALGEENDPLLASSILRAGARAYVVTRRPRLGRSATPRQAPRPRRSP